MSTMPSLSFLSLWLLLFVTMTSTRAQTDDSGSGCQAVLMTNDLPSVLYYKVREPIRLECAARGDPAPEYKWKRNGAEFRPPTNDPRVYMMQENGTLVFARPEPKDAGVYQCFASNLYGVDMTREVSFQEAILKDFPSALSETHNPTLGRSFSLPCPLPQSVPDGTVVWVLRDRNGDFKAAESAGRVMDGDYNLLFTNVMQDDEKDQAYMCMLVNEVLRQNTYGPSHYIRLSGAREEFPPVTLLWSSPANVTGVAGQTLSIKCIFGGNPTPQVNWQRIDSRRRSSRVTLNKHELIIDDLQFDDAGRYECWAEKSASKSRVSKIFQIKVEIGAYFTARPKNILTGSGGMARFYCGAVGIPSPLITWFINGTRLNTDSTSMSRITKVDENTIEIEQVTASDSMVVQCNASNVHGSQHSSAILCVNADAPTITTPPERETKVKEGGVVTLTCRVTSTTPHLVWWLKDGSRVRDALVKPNGDLYITSATLEDGGQYKCEARNSQYRTTSREGTLKVCPDSDSDCMNTGNIFTFPQMLTALALLVSLLHCYVVV